MALALFVCLSGAAASWMSFSFIKELYRMHLMQMYDTYVERELIIEDMRLYDSMELEHLNVCSWMDTAEQDSLCV